MDRHVHNEKFKMAISGILLPFMVEQLHKKQASSDADQRLNEFDTNLKEEKSSLA